MNIPEYLTFDDVLLIPQYSEVESRSEVDTSTYLGNTKIQIPIISANMDSVTGFDMALAMGKLGGVGILHRFQGVDETLDSIRKLKANKVLAIPSIGIRGEDREKAMAYIKAGADFICIDVAHGHCKRALELAGILNEYLPVIAGNIATYEAAEDFADVGVKVLKVGIGPGSNCTTRVVTGHGMPQLSAIMEVARIKRKSDINVIADGGIRNSGDIVKALAAGADSVMVGSLLAGTDECPFVGGDVDKGTYVYRGMASREAKESFTGSAENYTPEGVARVVQAKGPVSVIVNNLVGGIRSGLSYTGVTNISDLQEFAKFCKVTSAGYAEGLPHGLLGK